MDAYHRFFAPICTRAADPVLQAMAAGPGTRLLDACCGPGYLAGRAIDYGCAVTAIDIAFSMASLAARLHPRASVQVGDVERLPYGSDRFDVVVCGIGIHHVTDPARAMAEFARVLAPHGSLALTVWDDSRSDLGIVKQAVKEVSPVVPAGLPAPPSRPEYLREDEVRDLLGSTGLRLRAFVPLTFVQRYPDPQTLWDGWLATAIHTGPLLAAQPDDVQHQARAAFDRLVADHLDQDGSISLRASLMLIIADA